MVHEEVQYRIGGAEIPGGVLRGQVVMSQDVYTVKATARRTHRYHIAQKLVILRGTRQRAVRKTHN